MSQYDRAFPLIADDEPVLLPVRWMQLDDESDDFVDERATSDALAGQKIAEQPKSVFERQQAKSVAQQPSPIKERSLQEQARQEAKADLKRKRKGIVTRETTLSPKPAPVQHHQSTKVAGEKTWSHYAQALRQTDYILAELPRSYEPPKNPTSKRPHRQNFDFLKKSQIHNREEYHRTKERQVAQELNLSTFDDID